MFLGELELDIGAYWQVRTDLGKLWQRQQAANWDLRLQIPLHPSKKMNGNIHFY